MKHGIHLFTEKPVSVEPPEKFNEYSKQVQDAIKANDVITSVGYMFRWVVVDIAQPN